MNKMSEVVISMPNVGRTREQVETLVLGYSRWRDAEGMARLQLVVDRIVATGECVFHAAAMVQGTRCYCADCMAVSRG